MEDRTSKPTTSVFCPAFKKCGACTQLDVAYEAQLASKEARIKSLFGELCAQTSFRGVRGMEDPFHYRNKVASPFVFGKPHKAEGRHKGGQSTKTRRGKSGSKAPREILTGMYAKGTHELVSTDECLLENKTGQAVIKAVRDLMRKWNIEPYDENTGRGFMRHVVIRVGHSSGEVLVTLVTNSPDFPSSKSFCRELTKRVPAITTVVQNVNLRHTNVILGDTERTLYGPGFILDTLCGLSFRISSHSFYQVNARQTEVLYDSAIELAELTGKETVIDAYCGTGTIGLVAAKRGAAHVIGVDDVDSAIRDARENARHNGIINAEFVAADASAFMRDLAQNGALMRGDGQQISDVVLMMDPPRAGSTPEFLDAAAVLSPTRIIYISCNPVTQVRDVKYLLEKGYFIESVQPVDMFPHTDHIENIVVLKRN